MNSGRLDRVVDIQINTPSTNAYGEQIALWGTTYAGVAAAVEPLNGREYFASRQIADSADVRFRLRYISGLTVKHRISYRGEIFNIQSIINPGDRNRELVLMTSRST